MIWFCLLFMSDPIRIFCLDGSQYQPESVSFEKGMVVCQMKEGIRVLLSDRLIDWNSTGPYVPNLLRQIHPDQAEDILAENKKRKTRTQLGGLAKRWDGSTAEYGSTEGVTSAPTGPIIEVISGGNSIDLNKHLVKGRLTVFDFYADWCGPCRQLSPKLEALAHSKPSKFALKKVDIINWQSGVSQQFQIRSIPYLIVMDENGKTVQKGNGFQVYDALSKM